MSKRINKLEDGFVAATSNNLPQVDFEMLMEFIQNAINTRLETQGWKMHKSGREGYGDNAVGYVQVKRKGKIVDVIARMTPEHKLHSTPYNVKAQIDENKASLNVVKCHDCIASQGKTTRFSVTYFRLGSHNNKLIRSMQACSGICNVAT